MKIKTVDGLAVLRKIDEQWVVIAAQDAKLPTLNMNINDKLRPCKISFKI